jgi:hypothetical protein
MLQQLIREAECLERELEILENRPDEQRHQMIERENVEEKVDVFAIRLEEKRKLAKYVEDERTAQQRWR